MESGLCRVGVVRSGRKSQAAAKAAPASARTEGDGDFHQVITRGRPDGLRTEASTAAQLCQRGAYSCLTVHPC